MLFSTKRPSKPAPPSPKPSANGHRPSRTLIKPKRGKVVTVNPASLSVLFFHLCLVSLRYQLDFSGSPGLIEPRFQRAIEAKNDEPALAGNHLHPVMLKTGRRFGAEIDIDGAIHIDLEIRGVTAHARELLIGLQHPPRLVGVEDDRPEILGRNVGGKVQFVGLGAVERMALRIVHGPRILRTLTNHLRFHGRRDPSGEVEEVDRAIQVAYTRRDLEPVA